MILIFAFHGTKNCKNISPFNEIFLKKISVKQKIIVISVRNISLHRKIIYIENFTNYKVIEISAFFLPGNFNNILLRFYNYFVAKILYFYLKKQKFLYGIALIHQIGLFTPIGIYFSEFSKKKLIIQIIGSDVFNLRKWKIKFKKSQIFTSNSVDIANEIQKKGYKAQVIYRGIDVSIHGESVELDKFYYDKIFYGGGFPNSTALPQHGKYNYKGGISLIYVLGSLEGYSATIAGPNCDVGKTFAKNNQIHGIKFVNYLSHKDLLFQIRRSDIVIIPSFSEGVANIAMEAMLAAKLVISREVGGMSELIENNKNGLLFSSDIELKETLNLIRNLRTENTRSQLDIMRVNARNTILDRFNNDRMIKEYNSIYNKYRKNS